MNRFLKRISAIALAGVFAALSLGTVVASAAEPVADTQMTVTMASEDTYPTVENIAIIGDTDVCDAELAELLSAKFEKYSYKETFEAEAFKPSTTPDAVFIITTEEDTVTKVEGQEPQTLSIMKARPFLGAVLDGVSEETPVIWTTVAEISENVSMARQFGSLLSVQKAMKRDNFIPSYGYYDKNADAEMRKETAKRILGPAIGAGAFVKEEEAENYNDMVYYVFENGNDKADGKSPATAKKTVNNLFKSFVTERNNNMASYNENDRIIIYISGHVQEATSQALFGIGAKSTPRTPEGKNIPVICQTYEYDAEKDNRAVIYSTYLPHDDGSSRMVTTVDLTLKNIELASEPVVKSGTVTLSCYYFWISRCHVTFDNCSFSNATSKPWIINCGNNCWDDVFTVQSEEERVEHMMTFKNGVYDETTGINYVVGNGAPSLWRDGKTGPTLTEAPNQFSTINVEKGAVIGKLYAVGGKMPYGGSTLNINPGGVVNILGATKTYSSPGNCETPITINVNGKVLGEIHGMGRNAHMMGESALNFNVKNAYILGAPVKEDDTNCDFLGETESSIEGNVYMTMENSLFAMNCGLNMPSAIYFAGNGVSAEGDEINYTLENNVFVMLPNEKLNSDNASIAFGGAGSTIYSDFNLDIKSGLFDMSLMPEESFSFGSADESSTFFVYNIVLGEAGKQNGPVFMGADTYVAGSPAWYGREIAADSAVYNDDNVMNFTVHNAVFTGDVYMAPITPERADDESIMNGSMEIAVNGGRFLGKTYLANGKVMGDINANLTGGTFADLYDGSDMDKENPNVLGTITVTREGAELLLLNGKPVGNGNLWLFIGIGAGVLAVVAAVIIIAVSASKKKKKA